MNKTLTYLATIVVSIVAVVIFFLVVYLLNTPKEIIKPVTQIVKPVESKPTVPPYYDNLVCIGATTEAILHKKIYYHNDANKTYTVGIAAECSIRYETTELTGFIGNTPVYDVVWKTKYFIDEKVFWNDRGTDHNFTHNKNHRILVGMK